MNHLFAEFVCKNRKRIFLGRTVLVHGDCSIVYHRLNGFRRILLHVNSESHRNRHFYSERTAVKICNSVDIPHIFRNVLKADCKISAGKMCDAAVLPYGFFKRVCNETKNFVACFYAGNIINYLKIIYVS